ETALPCPLSHSGAAGIDIISFASMMTSNPGSYDYFRVWKLHGLAVSSVTYQGLPIIVNPAQNFG
ncbi:hypothetical protein, partial [Microcoleus sp. herbarium14]|uniref:hypothetical protein n=1 Tax=Microcoleus sp. herbarium14 TaxID=3055439 RepID=UPI002FD5C454